MSKKKNVIIKFKTLKYNIYIHVYTVMWLGTSSELVFMEMALDSIWSAFAGHVTQSELGIEKDFQVPHINSWKRIERTKVDHKPFVLLTFTDIITS